MADLIGGFVEELRRRGLEVSPAERIDAARAVRALGVESRSLFRAALRATLAKTAGSQAIFDAAFESHFAPPRPGRARRRGRGREAGEGTGVRPGREAQRAGRLPPRSPGEKPPAGPPAAPRSRGRSGMRPARPEGRRPTGRLRKVTERRPRAAPGPAEAAGRRDLRRRDFLEPMSGEEEQALAAATAGIVREIRLRAGRRFGRGRSGRLWVKRMIRESLRQGGIPFTLPLRQRRPRRPRVTLLVDVSWSTARAAGLFLLICRQLADRLGRVRVHLFVDRVVEATREVELWASGAMEPSPGPGRGVRRASPGAALRPSAGAAAFEALLNGLPDLNPAAPSDYGRAFHQAESVLLPPSGRDRVLVVLGDARSNRRDPLPWAFGGLADACRRVIWLNPEPRARWDTGDSVMSEYLPFCDVACEVRDLDGLARGVREMVRSL